MRRYFWSVALFGVASLVSAARVEADPIDPSVLVPALGVYIDAIVGGHAAAQVCAAAKSPARDGAEWAKARAVLLATLWANGFPTDFVNDATRRLNTSMPPSKPDCDDAAVIAEFGDADHEGWLKDVGHGISGMDLTPISEPVSDEQWQAIKDAIAKELPLQKRGLDCVGVTMPQLILVAVHDWDAMIIKIGGKLRPPGCRAIWCQRR
jgi:hypothetical protein